MLLEDAVLDRGAFENVLFAAGAELWTMCVLVTWLWSLGSLDVTLSPCEGEEHPAMHIQNKTAARKTQIPFFISLTSLKV